MSKNRILLIMSHQGNRRLLTEMLSRRFEVIAARNERDLDLQFDLAILDGPALNRLRLQVRARKEADEPVFLPFLLLIHREDAGTLRRDLWRTVDELILTPVQRVELEGRVERLLRTRKDSLDLWRRGQELEKLISELSDAFESATDEDQLADILLARALAATSGWSGAVLLQEGEGQRVVASRGEDLANQLTAPSAALQDALQDALQRGVAANLSKGENAEQSSPHKPTIMAPVLIRQEPVGVLVIEKDVGARFDAGEFRVVESLCGQAGVFLNNLRQAHRLVDAARLQEQVELAETIQHQLLPATNLEVEGLDVAAMYLATNQIGGDYYDVFSIGPNLVGAVMADVSGHSIASGLIMTTARSALRLLVRQESRPAEVLRQLNDALYRDLDQTGLFLSIFLVVVDLDKKVAHYANAGHNPPFLFRQANSAVEMLDSTGLLIGILPDISYDEVALPLGAGDALLLYTDGITEARNAVGEMFGEERLQDLAMHAGTAPAARVVASIVKEIHSHAQNQLTDDVTLLFIRMALDK